MNFRPVNFRTESLSVCWSTNYKHLSFHEKMCDRHMGEFILAQKFLGAKVLRYPLYQLSVAICKFRSMPYTCVLQENFNGYLSNRIELYIAWYFRGVVRLVLSRLTKSVSCLRGWKEKTLVRYAYVQSCRFRRAKFRAITFRGVTRDDGNVRWDLCTARDRAGTMPYRATLSTTECVE